jgi:hypothetical protein
MTPSKRHEQRRKDEAAKAFEASVRRGEKTRVTRTNAPAGSRFRASEARTTGFARAWGGR